MKNHLKFLLLCLLAIAMAGCVKNEPPGPTRTQVRDIPAYTELEVRGDFDVELVDDQNFTVEITAPENLLPYIETTVVGHRLIVDESYNRIRESPIHIRISNTEFEWIELNGSGHISSQSLTSDHTTIVLSGSGDMDLPVACTSLDANLSGSGNITLFGSAPTATYTLSGSGNLNAQSIDSHTAVANLRGSGNIRLFTSDTLIASLTGSGNIRYWGNPQTVETHITGSGNIIHQ